MRPQPSSAPAGDLEHDTVPGDVMLNADEEAAPSPVEDAAGPLGVEIVEFSDLRADVGQMVAILGRFSSPWYVTPFGRKNADSLECEPTEEEVQRDIAGVCTAQRLAHAIEEDAGGMQRVDNLEHVTCAADRFPDNDRSTPSPACGRGLG